MIQLSLNITFIILILGIIMYIYNGNRNIIYILISLEVLLLTIGLLFLQISFILDDLLGSLFTLYILPLAGAESALGLSILIRYYPNRGTLIMK
jgi:NADH-ubiquinone oxidoreductase chain 4L